MSTHRKTPWAKLCLGLFALAGAALTGHAQTMDPGGYDPLPEQDSALELDSNPEPDLGLELESIPGPAPAPDLDSYPGPGVTSGVAESDVPYVPTPRHVVNRMLKLAGVDKDDVVYDLGSGDGRIVIQAARKFGARGVGIEIDPVLVERARRNARDAGVSDLVEFRKADLFQTDLSEATVLTLYLLTSVNLKLRPKLFEELEPGTPVVSHSFDMGAWEPEKTVKIDEDTIYRWTISEEKPEHLQDAGQ